MGSTRAPRDASDVISNLIARAPTGANFPDHWRALAQEHDALPVWQSWTGTLFLRRDGSAFYIDEEEPGTDALPGIKDEKRVLMAIMLGRERFPELGALLPERSNSDPDCPVCGGAGRLPVGGKPYLLCAACGVLGWIFAGDEEPLADPAWIEWARRLREAQEC